MLGQKLLQTQKVFQEPFSEKNMKHGCIIYISDICECYSCHESGATSATSAGGWDSQISTDAACSNTGTALVLGKQILTTIYVSSERAVSRAQLGQDCSLSVGFSTKVFVRPFTSEESGGFNICVTFLIS